MGGADIGVADMFSKYSLQIIDSEGAVVGSIPLSRYPHFRELDLNGGKEDAENLCIDIEDTIMQYESQLSLEE